AGAAIGIRSPGNAPPVDGDDGSMASTPTRLPCARSAASSIDVDVDLPTPGGPVSPMTCAFPVYGVSARTTLRSRGWSSATNDSNLETALGCTSREWAYSSPTTTFPVTNY